MSRDLPYPFPRWDSLEKRNTPSPAFCRVGIHRAKAQGESMPPRSNIPRDRSRRPAARAQEAPDHVPGTGAVVEVFERDESGTPVRHVESDPDGKMHLVENGEVTRSGIAIEDMAELRSGGGVDDSADDTRDRDRDR